MPLVQEHALGALEHHGALVQQRQQVRAVDGSFLGEVADPAPEQPGGLRGGGIQRPGVRFKVRAELAELGVQDIRGEQVPEPGRGRAGVQGVGGGLPDAHPARPVPAAAACPLPCPVRRDVERGDQQRVHIDSQQPDRVPDTYLLQVARLGEQRQRIRHHEAGQVRPSAPERPGPELGERVMPPVFGDHVVAALTSPVEPHYCPGRIGMRG